MRLLDYSFDDPAANLACDEVLLNLAEEGAQGESLRLWESPTPFVVLGVSQEIAEEVREDACRRDGVPILRRCSAGGCVLQGPGCLNYSLVLSVEDRPEMNTIHGAYRAVATRLADAFAAHGLTLAHQGTSDLAVDGLKVSGNAQKRRRRYILYHGTLLYRDDGAIAVMERYLREPADRPDYRGNRTHQQFVTVLPLNAGALKATVAAAFECDLNHCDELSAEEHALVRTLVAEKYGTDAWNRRR
jgi:lipoate-protein ligase A